MMKISALYVFLFLSATYLVSVISGRMDPRRMKSDDEKINMVMERMDSREIKIKEMIEERKNDMAEHEAGRTLLNSEDHARVKRQIVNFGRKLDQMRGMSAKDKQEMVQREVEMFDEMRGGSNRYSSEL